MPAAMKAAAAAALQPAEGHAFESRLWRLHLEQRNMSAIVDGGPLHVSFTEGS